MLVGHPSSPAVTGFAVVVAGAATSPVVAVTVTVGWGLVPMGRAEHDASAPQTVMQPSILNMIHLPLAALLRINAMHTTPYIHRMYVWYVSATMLP